MKKFLLTASMLVMGIVATFAQVPDASKWKVGDEITKDISWGNLSFESDPMDYWTLKADNITSPTTKGGAFEAYDNSGVELYQYVQLPAGMYKVECQGYYRGGNSGSDNPSEALKEGQCAYNWLNQDSWVDNAFLTVYNGEYDKDKDVFTPNHQFKTPLMPRLFENVSSQIFDEGSEHPDGWNKSDYYYTDLGCYGPTSFPGSYAWFQAGQYMPYDKDGDKYNTVTFFLTEDGYVKVGVVKKEKISQDTFFVTNFKMYYMGEAGEAAALLALQDDCNDLYNQLVEISDNSVGFLKGKIEEELMLFNMEYDDPYSLDKEEATSAKAKLTELLEGASAAKDDLAGLTNAIQAVENLAISTNYSGKDALTTVLDEAKTSVSEDYIYEGEDWSTYKTLTDKLYKARLDYLLSSPKSADGSYNFSAFITTPFFCDAQYTPVWDEEAQAYVYPTIEGVEESLQPDNTWATIQETGYSDAKADASHADWIPICDNVTISEKFVENQWVIKSTTWHGGGPIAVTMQHSYSAIGGWTENPTGNPELLYQTISGLPNGFYSMSALMCNAGAAISELQYAYIESGESKATAPLTKQGNPWWGGNKESWRSGVWEKLTTDMISVENGEVTIGTSSDAFYASTGFQLYYYGETPDFAALLKPTLEKAQKEGEALPWKGDQKAVAAILAKVPATISNKESYLAAAEVINEANDYISKAKNAIANWKGLDNFTALSISQPTGSVEESIVSTALLATMELGESEDDVYTDAVDNGNRYNAYVSYLGYRESIGEFITNPLVAPVIEEQNAYLVENFATVEKIDEFLLAIGTPYNKAKFEAEGAANASLTNPLNVSFLLINPTFDEGCEKGWTVVGTGAANNNEYSYDETGKRVNAELWNRDAFTFSQIVSGLPAGTYEFRARALYREGNNPSADRAKSYLAGDEEYEYNDNAVLFAKNGTHERSVYLKAIESLKATENSFTQCGTAWEYDEVSGTNYPVAIHYLNGTIDEADQQDGVTYTGHDDGGYPLDAKITVTDNETLDEVTYYYPASMQGFYQACKKDPNAYTNAVLFHLTEAGNVELGIRKTEAVGGDWVIMDDFELYYLGTEIPTAIDEVAENAAEGAVEYYSVNGVKLDAPQPGFNIVKYADGTVKKVFIK